MPADDVRRRACGRLGRQSVDEVAADEACGARDENRVRHRLTRNAAEGAVERREIAQAGERKREEESMIGRER